MASGLMVITASSGESPSSSASSVAVARSVDGEVLIMGDDENNLLCCVVCVMNDVLGERVNAWEDGVRIFNATRIMRDV